MILICGGLADTVTELVCARLDDCGYPYRLLDLGHYPTGYRIRWHWSGSGPVGYIASDAWRADLDDLTGVFVRFLGPEGREPPPKVSAGDAWSMYAEYDVGLTVMLEDLPCAVVNRLGGGMSNCSKVYQALMVRDCGLLTPRTLVTSDPVAALNFYEECQGEVIYKSLSGVRSIVRRLRPERLDRLPLLRNGPVQFQQFIEGENVRVHTVGGDLYATRVLTDAVDYRYARDDEERVQMEPAILPPKVGESCRILASRLDLLMSGIDLKLTPEGDYYCFEVNPCPGFLYYEKHTRQPISAALAELLHAGKSETASRQEVTLASDLVRRV